jgi:hypothetical protein
MTDAAALELRHVRLAEHVPLRPAPLGDGEEGVFVALDDSPPVRTVVAVVQGGRRRALEVAWVVEVAEREEARGFYGRWLGDEALERAAKVGTEHLEDGMPVVQPVVLDNSVRLDVSDTPVMAMPAPVMMHDDDTGVVDTDDEDGGDGEQANDDILTRETVHYPDYDPPGDPEPAQARDTVLYSDYPHPEQAAGSAEQADSDDAADATEASSDAGEPGDGDAGEPTGEPGDGDAGESRSKGSRKKRGRRKR